MFTYSKWKRKKSRQRKTKYWILQYLCRINFDAERFKTIYYTYTHNSFCDIILFYRHQQLHLKSLEVRWRQPKSVIYGPQLSVCCHYRIPKKKKNKTVFSHVTNNQYTRLEPSLAFCVHIETSPRQYTDERPKIKTSLLYRGIIIMYNVRVNLWL